MKEKRVRCCPRCARGVLPRLADIKFACMLPLGTGSSVYCMAQSRHAGGGLLSTTAGANLQVRHVSTCSWSLRLLQPFRKETKSQVLPRLRKGGVAPPSGYMCISTSSSGCCPGSARGVLPHLADICVYIYLLRISTYKLSAPFLPLRSLCGHPYRPAYLPHIDTPSPLYDFLLTVGQ